MVATANNEVVITGDVVIEYEKKEVRRTSLKAMLPFLTTRQPLHLWNAPRNLRGHFADPTPGGNHTKVWFLIEQEPAFHHITYRGYGENNGTHRLTFPWCYFLFECTSEDPNLVREWAIRDWSFFIAPRRVVGPDDYLYPPILPNTDQTGRICTGGTAVPNNVDFGAKIDTQVNTFWTSTFNDHLGYNFPNNYKTYPEWVKAGEEDPSCWMNWENWNYTGPHRKKVKDAMALAPDRFDPLFVPGTIPAIPDPYVFTRIDDWLKSLSAQEQERMRDFFAEQPMGQVIRPRHLTAR